MRFAWLLIALFPVRSAEPVRYELRGQLEPPARASVWLHGAITPFDDSTLADAEGRFRFRGLPAGTYTLGAFVPGRGEMRRTIELGPSSADAEGRIRLVVDLREAEFESRDSLRRRALVSAKQLAIPERANREYAAAAKKLSRSDIAGAVAHLKRAVEIAPQFAAAWNYLGTIAYQTRDYTGAEACFRKALAADSTAYEPLVNLGGVLVNLQRFDEALQYNRHAVLTHPNDALANSQLGMTWFYLGNMEMGRKYLKAAARLDPAHFSHPQLLLAEIDARQGDRAGAAGELEEFLKLHPDWPESGKIRENIARLRRPALPAAAPAPGPAGEYSATGMAQSFSDSVSLPALENFPAGLPHPARVDAVLGSGRHFRVLLSRAANGGWTGLPLAWYTEGAGHWGQAPAFTESACLPCHTSGTVSHLAAIGCQSCHVDGRPAAEACLKCHPGNAARPAAHGPESGGDDRVALNSAAFRLFQSRCYKSAGEKLKCVSCHPPHTFSRTTAGYRQVCRGCHPATHNSAALECTRCHMPRRPADDVAGVMVTDHKIQRPL